MDGFTVLHSGHSVPQFGDAVQRGEGVAVALDPLMIISWRDSREHDLPLAPGLYLLVYSFV